MTFADIGNEGIFILILAVIFDKKAFVYGAVIAAVIFLIGVFVIGVSYLPMTLFLDLVFIIVFGGFFVVVRLSEWFHAYRVL